MKRTLASILLVVLTVQSLAAVGGKNAQYIGGTLKMNENAEGKLNTTHDTLLIFETGGHKDATRIEIPYKSIVELEYGQKAGRRIGAAVGTSLLLGPIGLVTLFSKKRKHYLSISYNDTEGKEQAGVFELGKDIIRTSLKVIETRSGKDIIYQDEEARKSGVGGK